MPKSSSLSLSTLPARTPNLRETGPAQPLSPRSPRSPPFSGSRYENNGLTGAEIQNSDEPTPLGSFQPPASPSSPRHRKDSSRSFFSNVKASKSSPRINTADSSIPQASESSFRSSGNQVYSNGRSPGSTPELNRTLEDSDLHCGASSNAVGSEQGRNGGSLKSNSVSHINTELNGSKRTLNKHKVTTLLSRTKSIRVEEGTAPRAKPKVTTPSRLTEPYSSGWKGTSDMGGMKTAPLEKGQSWRQNMHIPGMRNHSADRHSDNDSLAPRRDRAEQTSLSSSYNESRGATLMSTINTSSRKAADKIDSARRAVFGKLSRSGSSHEKEVPREEDNYQCKVINLGLVEQTRKTRISKRLEASKDKTEFWMPALPWRCIDYLNMKGCEEEGLYRVPGSGKDIKYWQRRFDQELDINLFDEPDLYDINIIGSMFKAWLRDLPDEIFPKATQNRIQTQCHGAKSTPQMLKDELSKLPPFNYYLLFAITCHISLLHSCSELNRMDYRNLCICFQPCMKIDAFCFQFLILDWRNCWQGCWTEKEYLAEEIALMKPPQSQPPHRSAAVSTPASSYMGDERALSSSGSSKPSIMEDSTPEKSRPLPLNGDRGGEDEDNSATPTQAGHSRLTADNKLAKLDPIPPPSPFAVKFS
ncbi:hypothetical protein K432DRAFT_415125 [Lepidopterella palustris CBS 459.81]|uniref:Rho-GAP domain-containing protein n=1 Tax=Lepidopterella palustris CBS 459.81 TaxID=1314670 RepID=A0A8E2JHE1_9PEZI|nr:hypothetical protein K432DRAFT_415125 [Lepidopterella palustris CBS 459.81]